MYHLLTRFSPCKPVFEYFFAMNKKLKNTALKSYNISQNIIKLLPADKQGKAKYLLGDSVK